MITEEQADQVLAFLRDCQAIAAVLFYQGRTDPARIWVMRWLGRLLDCLASGVSPEQAVAACRPAKFSPLRAGGVQ